MNKTAEKFTPILSSLRCPKCKGRVTVAENSLLCESGHRYDFAAKGYLNVAPNAHASRYDKTLFEARRRILNGTLYSDVVEAIQRQVNAFVPSAWIAVDCGCGEGTFLWKLGGAKKLVGIDLSKDAIRMAASGGNPLLWMVADLTSLPFSEESVDVLYNILSPAHYGEFSRVLSKDGILVKVIPNASYLGEIRALVKADSIYSNEKVLLHLRERFSVIDEARITKTHPITETEAQDFLRMTPLLFGLDPSKADVSKLGTMTVDVTVVTAKKR